MEYTLVYFNDFIWCPPYSSEKCNDVKAGWMAIVLYSGLRTESFEIRSQSVTL